MPEISSANNHAHMNTIDAQGNEIWPVEASPPPDIHAALATAVTELDPTGTIPHIQTSMGSASGVPFDPVRVLAPSDGPYYSQDSREWFKRNPVRVPHMHELGNASANRRCHPHLPLSYLHVLSQCVHPTVLTRCRAWGATS